VVRGLDGPGKKEGHYFIVFDYAGTIVDASASTTRILGYSRNELLRMKRLDLHSDISKSDYEMLRTIILTGIGSPAFDTVHRKKNGHMIPVKLRVKVLTAEASKYALIIAKVLGKDPAAVAEETRGRYECSINARGQFLYISNLLASRLDYRWIELIGKPLIGLLRPMGGKKGRDTFERLLASERFFQLRRAELLCRDGSSLPLDFSFHPHEDDFEGFQGYDVAGTVLPT
jgi:PAS domain S-box-containing protein